MQKIQEKIKQESEEIKREVKEKILGYVLTALGLVAALAWNDAIKAFIEHLFPLDKGSIFAKFIYALIITVVIVIFSIYLTKILKRK